MATWDYRIVRRRDCAALALHEVYYDDDGAAWGMTDEPCSFACDVADGPGSIIESLRMALNGAMTSPIFDEPERWPGKTPDEEYPEDEGRLIEPSAAQCRHH